jgi:hypothetical protein
MLDYEAEHDEHDHEPGDELPKRALAHESAEPAPKKQLVSAASTSSANSGPDDDYPEPSERDKQSFEAFLRRPDSEWARDIALRVLDSMTGPDKPKSRVMPDFITSGAKNGKPTVREVEPTVVQDKMQRVVPRTTTENVRIGNHYYQFQKGKPIEVPAGIVIHLAQKGIV